MISKPILLRADSGDTFQPVVAAEAKLLTIDLSQPEPNTRLLRHKVFEQVEESNLSDEIRDLLLISLMAYTADQTVSRANNGYLGWSRHFQCYVPVVALNKWEGVRAKLEEMLSFLTGDKWEFIFRQAAQRTSISSEREPNTIDKVCLFSGGLDSFIGAIDLLEEGKELALISHYKAGTENRVQGALIDRLQQEYPTQNLSNYSFYVQPTNQSINGADKEITSRGRSLLFIGLGLAVANSLGNIPLVIPENGFISLNVPLTFTRHGSHSTRTTHPYFLHSFQTILEELEVPIRLENPYQFKTKGKMVRNCKNQAVLRANFQTTLSCAHPDIARFKGLPPGTHCGYCTPCIIRRASLEQNGLRDSLYVKDVMTEEISPKQTSGRDPRAFRLALKRFQTIDTRHLFIHLMSSGPLSHLTRQELVDLTRMYQQGMQEIEHVLK